LSDVTVALTTKNAKNSINANIGGNPTSNYEVQLREANAIGIKNLTEHSIPIAENATTYDIMNDIAKIPSLKYTTLTTYASLFEGAKFPANTELTVYVGKKVVDLIGVFASATNLKKVKFVGYIDTCSIEQAFASSSVEEVDFSGLEIFQATSAEETFATCNNLVRVLGEIDAELNFVIWGFEDCPKLKEVYFKKNSIVCDVNIPNSPELTTKSVQSIIDGINDTGAGALFLHSDVKNRLTEKQKKELAEKGWSVE